MDELRAIELDRFAQMLPEATLKGMTHHPQDLGYFWDTLSNFANYSTIEI
ncbi:MAG: hypothetical protein HC849_19640 [Oscillatoriales cyanobacterium RU_3_3]|nr:hypothetical protein [Microcoleus sp. SM1_3_4]NJM61910.1 hypothetical protein [Oscillatoriales cyanobacterium RU_3_3]NJR22981.1 hypothetical protein [Richelia sp. CSU_2_1]